jgi:hypothetical protein
MIEARTDDGLAGLNLPEVVPRETWLRARIDLLERVAPIEYPDA